MVSEDRQRVIEANRSLRLIKNELEALLEKGVISDEAFDSIHRILPTESSISGAPTPAARTPAPRAPNGNGVNRAPSPPVAALNNLNLEQAQSHAPPPPTYAQSTGGSTASGPPPLPGRRQPPAAPPSKPVLSHAKALYKYNASDARDCSFEAHDRIAVYEYMNNDWWMGKNLRTGQEGIFPKSYVEPESAAPPPQQQQQEPYHNNWDEKNAAGTAGGYPGAGYQGPSQPQYGGSGMLPPPPSQVNPYNASAPPMAVANDQGGQQSESGVGKHGKKFGKKLGNAAIFGAGATIGSNIVNSIF
ncbi:hypothetical protein B0H63DRAFT_56473 [Podospora didyma]|uniref:SH3 domain-containing protein n=1 Tax=Podospora didyma TaxID=330526 RepID=A0AAE0P7J7_9PEZI|nr:hypothetical protein B0H63DRAFT_56473 [Podospora didyma]